MKRYVAMDLTLEVLSAMMGILKMGMDAQVHVKSRVDSPVLEDRYQGRIYVLKELRHLLKYKLIHLEALAI